MEFSEVFGFLQILNESIKLLPRNWKLMGSIAILSLLLPSILFLISSYFIQFLLDNMAASFSSNSSQTMPLTYLALLLALEIAFFLAYFVIIHLSGIATILLSATSYTGKSLSFEDFFSSIKQKWRNPLSTSFRISGQPGRYLAFVGILTVLLVILYPNPVTFSIAIFLWIIVLVYQLYSSVVWALSIVVSVVEDSFQGKEALERAARLVKGQRLHGFMLNLFFNLLVLIICLVYWMIFGDKGSLNLTIYGFFFVNFLPLARISVDIAYTVLYFKCKEHHGEEIEVFGSLQYTKLPTTALGSDIP